MTARVATSIPLTLDEQAHAITAIGLDPDYIERGTVRLDRLDDGQWILRYGIVATIPPELAARVFLGDATATPAYGSTRAPLPAPEDERESEEPETSDTDSRGAQER